MTRSRFIHPFLSTGRAFPPSASGGLRGAAKPHLAPPALSAPAERGRRFSPLGGHSSLGGVERFGALAANFTAAGGAGQAKDAGSLGAGSGSGGGVVRGNGAATVEASESVAEPPSASALLSAEQRNDLGATLLPALDALAVEVHGLLASHVVTLETLATAPEVRAAAGQHAAAAMGLDSSAEMQAGVKAAIDMMVSHLVQQYAQVAAAYERCWTVYSDWQAATQALAVNQRRIADVAAEVEGLRAAQQAVATQYADAAAAHAAEVERLALAGESYRAVADAVRDGRSALAAGAEVMTQLTGMVRVLAPDAATKLDGFQVLIAQLLDLSAPVGESVGAVAPELRTGAAEPEPPVPANETTTVGSEGAAVVGAATVGGATDPAAARTMVIQRVIGDLVRDIELRVAAASGGEFVDRPLPQGFVAALVEKVAVRPSVSRKEEAAFESDLRRTAAVEIKDRLSKRIGGWVAALSQRGLPPDQVADIVVQVMEHAYASRLRAPNPEAPHELRENNARWLAEACAVLGITAVSASSGAGAQAGDRRAAEPAVEPAPQPRHIGSGVFKLAFHLFNVRGADDKNPGGHTDADRQQLAALYDDHIYSKDKDQRDAQLEAAVVVNSAARMAVEVAVQGIRDAAARETERMAQLRAVLALMVEHARTANSYPARAAVLAMVEQVAAERAARASAGPAAGPEVAVAPASATATAEELQPAIDAVKGDATVTSLGVPDAFLSAVARRVANRRRTQTAAGGLRVGEAASAVLQSVQSSILAELVRLERATETAIAQTALREPFHAAWWALVTAWIESGKGLDHVKDTAHTWLGAAWVAARGDFRATDPLEEQIAAVYGPTYFKNMLEALREGTEGVPDDVVRGAAALAMQRTADGWESKLTRGREVVANYVKLAGDVDAMLQAEIADATLRARVQERLRQRIHGYYRNVERAFTGAGEVEAEAFKFQQFNRPILQGYVRTLRDTLVPDDQVVAAVLQRLQQLPEAQYGGRLLPAAYLQFVVHRFVDKLREQVAADQLIERVVARATEFLRRSDRMASIRTVAERVAAAAQMTWSDAGLTDVVHWVVGERLVATLQERAAQGTELRGNLEPWNARWCREALEAKLGNPTAAQPAPVPEPAPAPKPPVVKAETPAPTSVAVPSVPTRPAAVPASALTVASPAPAPAAAATPAPRIDAAALAAKRAQRAQLSARFAAASGRLDAIEREINGSAEELQSELAEGRRMVDALTAAENGTGLDDAAVKQLEGHLDTLAELAESAKAAKEE
ncbi:MAG: hypothetical protein HY696_01075 [Deltaproteobacteria bacterium]|nr:hypothetical protein [Deltaproteobacteria bacterium]